MKKVGFIGMGIMGLPMAMNLVKNGVQVTGFDVVESRRKAFEENKGIST
ncbi:MAG TPA: 3-hydroxyisobutyrate dehydrogenase, partial [Clostridiales bacterium]|nr:3-hydroxyisobutyrate dehydrogenase [Clostridiales bacterium]